MSPSRLRRLGAHLAKFGESYSGPRTPPTSTDRIKLLPQSCCECGNKQANRELLPPEAGRFFTNHNGTRWICHHCLSKTPTIKILTGYNTAPR